MPSYDFLYNMTGRNISDYLIKTRGDFYKRRYGGFEFGVHNPLANRNLSQAEDIADKWLRVRRNNIVLYYAIKNANTPCCYSIYRMSLPEIR